MWAMTLLWQILPACHWIINPIKRPSKLNNNIVLSLFLSYGFEPAATTAGATGQVFPRGRLQGLHAGSLPQHHLLPRCMRQAVRHQEGKRSVRRTGLRAHRCGLRDLDIICLRSSLQLAFPLCLCSSSKPRQRASRLRWILIRLWWKTLSVWMRWRRTWRLCSAHSKMTSHATSASEPRQVLGFSFLG